MRLPRLAAFCAAPLAAATGLVVLVGAPPAAADPLADAKARAAALADVVNKLQTRAEVATERYDAIEARLGQAVTAQSLAQRQAEADQASAASATDLAQARVRALYESGGRSTLLATVLAGSDPVDAMSRLHIVGSLLSFDSEEATASTVVADNAVARQARLEALAARVTKLEDAAGNAAGRVRALLAAQRRALRSANHQVRVLVAQRQAALTAASAVDFQTALAAAGGHLSPDMTPPNAIAAGAIEAAKTRLGDPYVWGATGPSTFDCSGLTQWSYAHVGVTLPRVAADQYNAGPHVALADLEPGDLLFWATDLSNPATIHHVAMYLGGGMMIAAPHTGDVVKVQPVYMSGYIGATRPYSTVLATGVVN
jgi:cell wall-associated NlpC family hydrolase